MAKEIRDHRLNGQLPSCVPITKEKQVACLPRHFINSPSLDLCCLNIVFGKFLSMISKAVLTICCKLCFFSALKILMKYIARWVKVCGKIYKQ